MDLFIYTLFCKLIDFLILLFFYRQFYHVEMLKMYKFENIKIKENVYVKEVKSNKNTWSKKLRN